MDLHLPRFAHATVSSAVRGLTAKRESCRMSAVVARMSCVDLVETRRKIYQQYAAAGTPPKLATEDLVALEADHAVVLGPDGTIAFANPFASGPAPYRIQTSGAVHYAICPWDALGVLAALGGDGVADGHCPDCGEPIAIRIREGALDPAEAVVHFLVPAANWYADLGFA